MVQNSAVATNIDNFGTVRMSQKGYCVKCAVTDTLLRTVYEVATALNGTEYVIEITRCSTTAAVAADAISKCDFKRLDIVMPFRNAEMEKIPREFLKWLYQKGGPKPDRDLGQKIIDELKANGHTTIL